jgi:hypothetical protein
VELGYVRSGHSQRTSPAAPMYIMVAIDGFSRIVPVVLEPASDASGAQVSGNLKIPAQTRGLVRTADKREFAPRVGHSTTIILSMCSVTYSDLIGMLTDLPLKGQFFHREAENRPFRRRPRDAENLKFEFILNLV